MKTHIAITSEAINIYNEHLKLVNPRSGAICVFIGTVRDFNREKEVNELYFEAYEKMALLTMEALAHEAKGTWPLHNIVMVHAIGFRKITDPVVFIGTSSAHRDAAFQASRFLIDQLKETVPIWKKETYQNDSAWISTHP